MRRRQGTLRKVQITPHAPRCRCLSHPITILAKENPNSFARMPDFWEIRAISHQSSHPRRKTSHFFCKDYHPAGYYVCNSPHFKQSPPRTRRKESCSKLCVATQNYAAEYRFFCKDYHPAREFVHNSPRFTDNHLPSDSLSIKQGILRTKHLTLQFTIAGHAPHSPLPPRNQNKRARQRNLCRTLLSYHFR